MLVNLRGVEGGDAAFGEEISKNCGSHLVQFIELKHLPLARPLGERANAGARFENHVVRSNNGKVVRSEEHTSELQSLMRISYAVFCLKKKNTTMIKSYK